MNLTPIQALEQLNEIHLAALRLDEHEGTVPRKTSGDSRPIILCGAGPLGEMTLAHLREVNIEPVAFTDNAKARWGTAVGGLMVIPPAEAVERYAQTARFVVTIYNGSIVRRQLSLLGCVNVDHFADLFFEHSAEFLPFCGLAARQVPLASWSEVVAAAGLWDDLRSRDEYLSQLAWRLRVPHRVLPSHDSPAECYFPSDLFHYLDDEVLFDCGAFDGDSLRQYLRIESVALTARVVAFEPDSASFARLSQYVAQLPKETRSRVRLEPWALAEKTGDVTFAALGSVRSGVVESGGAKVHGVALDELDIVPTLIKMDVEGFELAALKGAAATLKRHRPVLAISLYHHASDLWTIPNYLKNLVPDYQLFLRRYAEDCWEQVLYAVPGDRLVRKK